MQLTEQMVLVRSKEHHLRSIKKLNIWGCNLTDISVLEKVPNLEVAVLSENRIKTLKSFQRCFKLQELYLRFNNIQDINELIYLRNLPLKRLVLADNPCCNDAGGNYRINVIKILPFLECLDNENITRDELEMALNLRIIERNLESQKQSLKSTNKSQNEQQAIDNFEYELNNQGLQDNFQTFNRYERFDQRSDQRLNCVGAMQYSRSQPTFLQQCGQSHMNSNKQFAGDNINLMETNQHRLRNANFQKAYKDNYHRSYMDLSEWEKQNLPHENQFKFRTFPNTTRPGYQSERAIYRSHNDFTSDRGYISPRSSPGFLPSAGMNPANIDSSRSSSIISNNQGKMPYPRSRQVNLLCASLRFILELDALSLVDVLSTIRERIEQLYSMQ